MFVTRIAPFARRNRLSLPLGAALAALVLNALLAFGQVTTALRFVPVTPCRILDTRNANGIFGGPIMSGGASRDVPIPQSGCAIPASAQAYSLNATVVPPAGLGFISIWPAGQPQPVVSTLNSFDGRIVANAAIVPAGANGAISIFASSATHVVLDINGYFVAASTPGSLAYYRTTPCRVADTRGNGFSAAFGQPALAAGTARSFPVRSSNCGIPATAAAYSLNVTVVPLGPLGFLTAWPTGQAQPLVSTLNSVGGDIVANAAIVPAGTNGDISLFANGATNVVVDINGYFAPAGSPEALALYTLAPCRVADTRGNGFTGSFGAPLLAGNTTRAFSIPAGACGAPVSAAVYSLNLTVVPPAGLGFLTAWPAGQVQPVVSTLNSPQGKVLANAALVPAGTGGAINIFVNNSTELILDINGYFAPSGESVSPSIVSTAVTAATAGQTYSYAVNAVNPNPPGALVFSLPIAPAGMAIDPGTGLIQWTPTPAQVGANAVQARVQDAQGRFGVQLFTVTVAGPADSVPPSLTSIGAESIGITSAQVAVNVNEMATVRIDFGLSSAYGSVVTSTAALAHRLTLTALSGMTDYHFRVRATDLAGNFVDSADQTFRTLRPGPSSVTTSGRVITMQRRRLDGTLGPAESVTLRCVNWSPAGRDTNTTPNDINNTTVRRPEFDKWFRTDVPLIAGMRANCVRLYIDPGFDSVLGPKGLAVLDALYLAGISVIMTVDDAIGDVSRATQAVTYYRNHPAILMFSVGNEVNVKLFYQPMIFTVPTAMARVENLAAAIKALDPNHPVVASMGDIEFPGVTTNLAATSNYVNTVCPSVSVWSFNVYRGRTFTNLFSQWASISNKPMFIGEWGVDAYDSNLGMVNEPLQVEWSIGLWDDILRNLVTRDPLKTCSGGAFFQFSEEYWKVPPATSQDTGGWASPGFFDQVGNEEYFRTVTIDRAITTMYSELRRVFDPAYQPSQRTSALRALSRGAAAAEYNGQYGFGKFVQDGATLYARNGGGGGGRGLNLFALHLPTNNVLEPGTNYDTYATRSTGTAMNALVDRIEALPGNTLILIAVADEAGMNQDDSCTRFTNQWVARAVQALEVLGSQRIRSVCFRDSFALAAVKGEGVVRGEARESGLEAAAQATVTLP